jgi:hypothetical protein
VTAALALDLAPAVLVVALLLLAGGYAAVRASQTHDWIERRTRRATTPEDEWRTCETCGQAEHREFEPGKGWGPWNVTTAAENPCKYGGAS